MFTTREVNKQGQVETWSQPTTEQTLGSIATISYRPPANAAVQPNFIKQPLTWIYLVP